MVLRELDDEGALVPHNWPVDVASALLYAERKGQIAPERLSHFLIGLSKMPILMTTAIVIDTWSTTLELARRTRLTMYDAAYLDLALQADLPLATSDRKLLKAAKELGIRRFGEGMVGIAPEN